MKFQGLSWSLAFENKLCEEGISAALFPSPEFTCCPQCHTFHYVTFCSAKALSGKWPCQPAQSTRAGLLLRSFPSGAGNSFPQGGVELMNEDLACPSRCEL